MCLVAKLKKRRAGVSATGGRKGTSNKDLLDLMPDIRDVADLERIRSDKTPRQVPVILDALKRLESRRIIPSSARAPESSVRAACEVIHEELCAKKGNQHLLKELWIKQQSDPAIRPFVEVVIRLWLISPPESVVESMGSVIQEVFGNHRQLDHKNAAKELSIRWNGPELCRSDDLVWAVRRKCGVKFLKRSWNYYNSEGTVIKRHRGVECPRVSVYAASTQQ